MHFASDNWAGAHPKIAGNLVRHAGGFAAAYGASDLDNAVEKIFCEIFEREVAVFFVATGTAANALSVTAASRPGGLFFAHREAHLVEDECGAPEYLSGGTRLHPVDGELSRIDPQKLGAAIGQFDPAFIHAGQPVGVSITQSTEIGTVYSLAEIDAIAGICRDNGLPLHMDGARFANALVSLGTTPAEMTWRRGVDFLSFGGTKNGCWCAEALVVLDPAKVGEIPFLRKRAAHLFSKSRFIAAQFQAYFEDDLWLETARHSNAMAARLAGHFAASGTVRLAWKPEANEVFGIMARETAGAFQSKGAIFHPWKTPHGFAGEIGEDETLCRFVTSFATTADDVDRFGDLIA
ncbi:MAG: low specificity L-threonine aldolase [Hyphomicrobiales bacterium]|nr:low specificity L-threonine aldolase [Hyphomicrobiales bacterium]